MKATAEISLYPLSEDYKELIIDFILRLKKYEGLKVQVNGMSTQIFGEYDDVMAAITAESRNVFENGKAVLMMKLTGTDQSIENLPEVFK
ncbi:hypothetical protein BH09BAC1_BH09BAC1_09210 [soil metagenome]